jgi:tetratricopeptide (TPR) repeat protein
MPQENNNTPTSTTIAISTPQLFDQALAFQQQKNWDQALLNYQNLLDQGRGHLSNLQASVVYHNMSNVAYEKGDFLKAYTWSKKAVVLNPGNSAAQEALGVYSKKFEVPVIAHQISNFDNLKKISTQVSLDAYLILSLILILFTLSLFLKNALLVRKKQLAEDFSRTVRWPAYSVLVVTLFVLSATWLRYSESQVLHAIVISEKAQVQTAAGENKTVIFEAPAGLELEVLKADQGYFQVRYPGAFIGWVAQAQLEILSLSFEQKE